MDNHHDIVAVADNTGVFGPDPGGFGIPGSSVDHTVDPGLEDGLHSIHVLTVLHLDQAELAVVHGHQCAIDQFLFRAYRAHARIELFHQIGV